MKTALNFEFLLASNVLATLLAAVVLPATAGAMTLNLELRESTGENPFARNVYACNCTIEQYVATPFPGPDWEHNSTLANPKFLMADITTNIAPAPPPGTPTTLDLIPEIPGADHEFIARVLEGTVLGFGAQGPFIRPQVQRSTTLTYYAGSILHTVTDPTGTEFVLFSMSGAPMAIHDPTVVGGLAGLSLPAGWSYASEVLVDELVVGTPGGVANLFGQGDVALWQELVVVPEPATATFLLFGLAALSRCGRRGTA